MRGEECVHGGQEPRREFFRCGMRNFAQNPLILEEGNAAASITSVKGEEKHMGSLPQRGRKR